MYSLTWMVNVFLQRIKIFCHIYFFYWVSLSAEPDQEEERRREWEWEWGSSSRSQLKLIVDKRILPKEWISGPVLSCPVLYKDLKQEGKGSGGTHLWCLFYLICHPNKKEGKGEKKVGEKITLGKKASFLGIFCLPPWNNASRLAENG